LNDTHERHCSGRVPTEDLVLKLRARKEEHDRWHDRKRGTIQRHNNSLRRKIGTSCEGSVTEVLLVVLVLVVELLFMVNYSLGSLRYLSLLMFSLGDSVVCVVMREK